MTLFDQALNLGIEISKTAEYKQLKAKEDSLRDNVVAMKLVEDFQALQKSYETIAMMGQPVTEENIKELEDFEKKAMENETVSAYYEATRRFQVLVEAVNAKIQEGIAGDVQQCGEG